MIPAAFDYKAPASVEETISLLQEYGYDAKIISGGMSLIPMMKFRMLSPQVLIDIGRIPGLDYLKEENGVLRIGALVRTATMEHSAMVAERYPLLSAAAGWVADPVVRNRGTVVGSVVHADPAGDWAAAMMAARAEIVLQGPEGERVVGIDDFLIDTFTADVREAEVAIECRVPYAGPRSGGSYQKIERKVGDYATAAVAAQVAWDERGVCTAAGIALCAVGPITLRARAAEEALVGQPLTEATIRRASELAAQESQPASDTRGTAEFKRDMVRVLTARALRQATQAIR
jgi:carbon-monoxide dehydrogenase medium subunit